MSCLPKASRKEPQYHIQIAAICHHEEIKLPVFCQDDLIWLLEPTLKGQYHSSSNPSIGMSLSFLEDAHPDVLTICHKQRILLLQLPEWDEEDESQIHPGFDLLKDLLLCSITGAAQPADPLRDTKHAGIEIQVASLSASELCYLLFRAFQIHSCLLDIELLAETMGYRKIPPFNHVLLLKAIIGKKAMSILSLDSDCFLVKKKGDVLDSSFLSRLIWSLRVAIGSYEASNHIVESCQTNLSDGLEKLGKGKLDTRRIPSRLIDYMARFEAVETALQVSKSKSGQAKLRKTVSEMEEATGIEYKLAKNGKTIEVINEQYKSRLAKNTRQMLEISLSDNAGQTHIFAAKTVSSMGKTSSLAFIGKEGDLAVAMLRKGAVPSSIKSVENIEIQGREDHSAAEIDGMKWRREIMIHRAVKNECLSTDCDPSQLLCSFLLGDDPPPVAGVIKDRTFKLMERPEKHKYNIIAARESNQSLNPSQAKAARAILSPLIGSHSMLERREGVTITKDKKFVWTDDDWRQQERLILIHGPPGTGKTSLITACCEQWQHSCTKVDSHQEGTRDSIYACCQSNVAVKNIAESFSRANINFKIIVSANFYVEWHEDLYTDIQSRLIRADELPSLREKMKKLLDNCSVILSTVSFLSSHKVVDGDCPLFSLRPMRLLFVDEASQIHLRAYPHLMQRFGPQVARIIFLGDDCQLPPFKGDELIDAGLSVFELSHLRKKAFLLDTCYRLAKPMASFISKNVYHNLLQCGPRNYNPKDGLLDCVSYVDVETSKEERQGTSRKNEAEVMMVTRLVNEYKKRGGAVSRLKVLTTYDAQRDALEEALKKESLSGASDAVFSVDSFQGRESDYIIFSLVKDGRPTIQQSKKRGHHPQIVKYLQPGLGFLSNDRRINVALTRAKKGIIVVSNRRFINDTAAETLVGKLQVEMQWMGEGGEMHWWDEEDIRNNRLPQALFGALPTKEVEEETIQVDVLLPPNGWD